MSAGLWAIHLSGKSGGKLVTLFGIFCNDGVSAGAGALHYFKGGTSLENSSHPPEICFCIYFK